MNEDVENTVVEAGLDVEFVKALGDAGRSRAPKGFVDGVMAAIRRERMRIVWRKVAAAAIVLVLCGFSALRICTAGGRDDLRSAVCVLVASQDANGGWANGQLSAFNVAALAKADRAGIEGARVAYRKGLRYLRLNGISELNGEEIIRLTKRASGTKPRGDLGAIIASANLLLAES